MMECDVFRHESVIGHAIGRSPRAECRLHIGLMEARYDRSLHAQRHALRRNEILINADHPRIEHACRRERGNGNL